MHRDGLIQVKQWLFNHLGNHGNWGTACKVEIRQSIIILEYVELQKLKSLIIQQFFRYMDLPKLKVSTV